MRLNKILLFLLVLLPYAVIKSQSCPSIKDALGNSDVTITCSYPLNSSKCFPLNITFPDIRNTNQYSVSAIPFPTIDTNTGTILGYKDDEYLAKIALNDVAIFGNKPFSFNYYGENVQSLIISSNGFVSFNENYSVGDYSAADITGKQIPNTYLPTKSIFGVYQDLDFTDRVGNVSYRVEGVSPCRKLIVNFNNGEITRTTQRSTTQIVLYELTNEIDVYVAEKPLPDVSATVRESLIGINNASGNGIAPINRNTGIWSATQEAYRFSPSGNVIKPQRIIWSGSATQALPTAFNTNYSSIDLCSVQNETITATAYYTLSNGVVITHSDDIRITFDPSYPQAKDFVKPVCNSSTNTFYQADLNPDLTIHGAAISPFVFKYYLDGADAFAGNANFLDASLPLNVTQKYFVRVESATNASCFTISNLSFLVLNNILLKNTVEICDSNNDGIERNFQLSRLNCQLFDANFAGSISFTIDNNPAEVTSADLTSATKIYVKYNTAQCGTQIFGPISVVFTSAPSVVSTPIQMNSIHEICDIISSSNPIYIEPFEWEKELKNRGIVFSNDPNVFKISVFETEENALQNVNPLEIIREGLELQDYTYDLFARIEYQETDACKGTCFSVLRFTVKVIFDRIILNVTDADTDVVPDSPTIYDTEDADIYLCEKNRDELVNLKNDADAVIKVITPTSGITQTFHDNTITANDVTNSGLTTAELDQILPDNITTKEFFVRYLVHDSCYVVKKLNYHILKPIAEKKKLFVCATNSPGNVNITLSNYDIEILGTQWNQNPKPTVTYYSDAALTNVITTLNVTNTPVSVYAVINSSLVPSCSNVEELTFQLSEIQGVITDNLVVSLKCDHFNNNEEKVKLTDYYSQFFNGNLANYKFEWFRNYFPVSGVFNSLIADPSQPITITGNTTFYLRISTLDGSSCLKKVELRFVFDFSAYTQVKLAPSTTILRCDATGTQTMSFDLREAIPKLYENQGNPNFADFIREVRFFENQNDAFDIANTNYLSDADVQNYLLPATTPFKTIYARYQSINGCFYVGEVVLKIIGNIKFNIIEDISVCDDNLDGVYTINLLDWVNRLNFDSNPNNDILTNSEAAQYATYTFYENGVALTTAQAMNYTINNAQPNITLKAEINGNCAETTTINFVLRPFINKGSFTLSVCDIANDGKETINLTVFENQLKASDETFEYYLSFSDLKAGSTKKIVNPNAYSFDENSGIFKFFVKIISSTTCPNYAEINLVLNKVPAFDIENFWICPKDVLPFLQPDFSSYPFNAVTYEWKNAVGTVISSSNAVINLAAGKYTLTITDDKGCSFTDEFEVLEKEIPVITKLETNGNDYTVIATGSKKILYSIDGISWQESNLFTNLPKGKVTFYVRFEDDNCIGEAKDGLVLQFPNSFTPNGDGINDVWMITDVAFFGAEKSVLSIYDRYGNLVFRQDKAGVLSWDGLSNGRKLPTATYWYHIALPDGRDFKGWVLLKNRN